MRTKPTGASVNAYREGIENQERRRDCDQLVEMMRRATGFSLRRPDISIYLLCESAVREMLLARLGRHRMGKSCLYIRRLPDVDLDVLGQLIVESAADCEPRNWKDPQDRRQFAAKTATREISK
jgi:hypothetical protein